MAVAGLGWLDFTLATKGSGLSELCAGLGLSLSETAVFGDNWNDQSMLHAAGRAYLMEAADPALRQALTRSRADEGRDAPRVCENVCDELEAILQCGP
jgi:hydroxymethylpyrimidine pyrophosphatase-like HAD family hydrolase